MGLLVHGLEQVGEVVALPQLRGQVLRHGPDVALQPLPHVPEDLKMVRDGIGTSKSDAQE